MNTIEMQLCGFLQDAPDTPYQRGYLAALLDSYQEFFIKPIEFDPHEHRLCLARKALYASCSALVPDLRADQRQTSGAKGAVQAFEKRAASGEK